MPMPSSFLGLDGIYYYPSDTLELEGYTSDQSILVSDFVTIARNKLGLLPIPEFFALAQNDMKSFEVRGIDDRWHTISYEAIFRAFLSEDVATMSATYFNVGKVVGEKAAKINADPASITKSVEAPSKDSLSDEEILTLADALHRLQKEIWLKIKHDYLENAGHNWLRLHEEMQYLLNLCKRFEIAPLTTDKLGV